MRVLIIDDDIDALKILQKLLGKENFEVQVLSKWHDAFEQVKSFHPHIILLDILLSGMDGRHISQQLKSNAQTRNIPIILITANPDVAKNIGTSGADDYLEKPFTKENLVNKINHLVQHYALKSS